MPRAWMLKTTLVLLVSCWLPSVTQASRYSFVGQMRGNQLPTHGHLWNTLLRGARQSTHQASRPSLHAHSRMAADAGADNRVDPNLQAHVTSSGHISARPSHVPTALNSRSTDQPHNLDDQSVDGEQGYHDVFLKMLAGAEYQAAVQSELENEHASGVVAHTLGYHWASDAEPGAEHDADGEDMRLVEEDDYVPYAAQWAADPEVLVDADYDGSGSATDSAAAEDAMLESWHVPDADEAADGTWDPDDSDALYDDVSDDADTLQAFGAFDAADASDSVHNYGLHSPANASADGVATATAADLDALTDAARAA